MDLIYHLDLRSKVYSLKERILSNFLNFLFFYFAAREMENKPKRHPSTDCGGKVEMIETSTFTNEILNGANPWLGSTTSTSTISYEDMKDIMSISPKDQSFSPETPGSEQGS